MTFQIANPFSFLRYLRESQHFLADEFLTDCRSSSSNHHYDSAPVRDRPDVWECSAEISGIRNAPITLAALKSRRRPGGGRRRLNSVVDCTEIEPTGVVIKINIFECNQTVYPTELKNNKHYSLCGCSLVEILGRYTEDI